MKIAIVLGCRPEIIKFTSIIRELEKRKIDYVLIHTGQHYSHEMDKVFFEELKLPLPAYNLDVGSGSHGIQTGKMMIALEPILQKEKPDVILVEGDTTSVLAGGLTAVKLGIKVGHVEAGLRSWDRDMPEEINRIVVDHISDYLFAPTPGAVRNLLNEGIPPEKIYMTGNTIVDAIKSTEDQKLLHVPNKYILVTVHRPSNVDTKNDLANILAGLGKIYNEFKIPLIFPVHPRTTKMMQQFGLDFPNGVNATAPVGFLECLKLEKCADLVLTDSGGIQEEACVLGIPSVTLRDNTERPETLEVGASVLSGNDPDEMLAAAIKMMGKSGWSPNVFGDGLAGEKIVSFLETCLPKK